jgi:hypothetical protein
VRTDIDLALAPGTTVEEAAALGRHIELRVWAAHEMVEEVRLVVGPGDGAPR